MGYDTVVLLLDGNSLAYRAYHAVPKDMSTRSDEPIGAVHGFVSMLASLLRNWSPSGVAVGFDRAEPTFRHVSEPLYKETRTGMPDDLVSQMGHIRKVLDSLGICGVDAPGYEADDILATLCDRVTDENHKAVVVSGDRDVLQLVRDPDVQVMYNRRGVTDYILYDEAEVIERVGVSADMYVQYAAFRGDVSDNLAGVEGVGEKTAAKLLNAYGSAEGVIAAADEQTPKLGSNISRDSGNVMRNIELMTLCRDVPLDLSFEDLCIGDIEWDDVRAALYDIDLRNLYYRLQEAF